MIKISKFQAATGMVCLAGVLAWGCSQTPEEVVGSTVQRVEGSLAAFSMSQAALLAQPLLAASEWLLRRHLRATCLPLRRS